MRHPIDAVNVVNPSGQRNPLGGCELVPYPVVPNPAAMQLMESSSAANASSCPAR